MKFISIILEISLRISENIRFFLFFLIFVNPPSKSFILRFQLFSNEIAILESKKKKERKMKILNFESKRISKYRYTRIKYAMEFFFLQFLLSVLSILANTDC